MEKKEEQPKEKSEKEEVKQKELNRIKQPPNPERFDTFELTKDLKGFEIEEKGEIRFFKLNSKGGWFDEFENYYDKNGNPRDPPSDVSKFDYRDYPWVYSDSAADDYEYEDSEEEDGK